LVGAVSFFSALAVLGAGSRRSSWLVFLAGLAACALFAWRLASAPTDPVSLAFRSIAALGLGLAGAIVLTLTGAVAVASGAYRGTSRPALVLDSDQREALAVVWRAVWSSRLLVWVAGVLGVLKLGIEPSIARKPPVSVPFGALGNLLMSPFSAWDSGAYLAIAQAGYSSSGPLRAFFPLYPILIRTAAWSPQAALIAGVVISLAAFAIGLYLLRRLIELESCAGVADTAVLVVAFSPMALFFSAIYTESLFLMFSVGSFYAARRGWWARAGIAGALAAATRISGAILLLPLLWLYRYGPRADRAAEKRPDNHAGLWTRYSIRRDAWYLLLVPLGAAAFFVYTGAHGDLLAPFHAQQTYWHRGFTPLLGAGRGLLDALRSLHQLAVGGGHHVLATPTYQTAGQLSDPLKLAAANLTDVAFLVLGCITAVGALRALPRAYGVYALTTIAFTASTYSPYEPLASIPRYLVVLFPCQIWLAQWARTPARRNLVLLTSAGLLAFFSSQFASWRWVA
jgi:hypothetical protein